MPRKPKPKEPMHARIERTWTQHPIISLSSIIGVLTIISLIAPGVFWAVNHFQTVEDAKRTEMELRRGMAWSAVQSIKTELIALRNRVNDCDIKKDRKETMTDLERTACKQYNDEFDDAARRFNTARDAAMNFGKDK